MTKMSNDVLQWNVSDLARSIKERKISPVEVTKRLLEEIAVKDQKLNAYITVMENEALKAAQKAEKDIQQGHYKSPLHGIPIAVKDNISVKDVKVTSASKLLQNNVASEDAELMRRLKAAGAIIIGKTNLHVLSGGATGNRSFYGPTRNPYDSAKIAGGSSSGSGASVGAHIAYGAIGSDTVGSIRIPSSFCGIVGMKPTYGSVSTRGTVPLQFTNDHYGPMTRSVKDNALMLNELVDHDPKDFNSIKRAKEDFTEEIGQSVKGMTIGIPSNYFYDVLQSEVRESVEESIQDLEQQGVNIKSIFIENIDSMLASFYSIALSEQYAAFEHDLRDNPHLIEEEVREILLMGRNHPASDYIKALQSRRQNIEVFKDNFKQVDMILTPTTPILPLNINQLELNIKEIDENETPASLISRTCLPANNTGFPSISVPGIPKNGFPVGLQLIGAPLEEKKLYRLASFIENMYM